MKLLLLFLVDQLDTAQLGRGQGQTGHTMAYDNGVLYIYGGVSGSLTNDIIAIHYDSIPVCTRVYVHVCMYAYVCTRMYVRVCV